MNAQTFDFAEDSTVEMWLARRLPFDTKTIEEKSACARLRAMLKRLGHSESEILSGVYTSLQGGRFDIENVLAYNIGMSSFAQAGRNGMHFRRIWGAPKVSPSGNRFEHHHAYQLVASPAKPANGVNLELELSCIDDVARVWWAVSGTSAANIAAGVRLPVAGRFALHVEVGMPQKKRLHNAIKKLLDGIVAALHSEPAPSAEAVDRLARYLSLPVSDVVRRLSDPAVAVLGERSGLVRPYRNFVQWHPEDDRCDSITVIACGSPGSCSVTVTELGETR
ncbi:hypothetical protein [Paraburkholderia tropica]|uniref:hypothetical protein n=1 Tax=Paraburkholderia tropica TaxID=92647 RepID=UPI003D2C01F8